MNIADWAWISRTGDQSDDHELVRELEEQDAAWRAFESGDPSDAVQPAAKVKPSKPAPVRLSVGLGDAAGMLSLSDEAFAQYVKPDIAVVRAGRRQLVAVRELERWLEDNGDRIESLK